MGPREFLDRLVSAVFPQRCVNCGRVTAYDRPWCGDCLLPRLDRKAVACNRCGKLPGGCVCGGAHPHYRRALAPFTYDAPLRDRLLELKQSPAPRLCSFLAGEMAASLQAALPGCTLDCAVPVPSRRQDDHAARLCSSVAALLELPVITGALLRLPGGELQRTLSRSARRDHAHRVFQTGAHAARLNGKQVLLVDDIHTTGATADACAALLLAAGASGVIVLTACSTQNTKKC